MGICVKLYPRVLFLFYFFGFFNASTADLPPQLTLRSVDFRSVHPKTCFGGRCVPLGSICPGGQIFPFLPQQPFFNGPNKAIILHGSKYETPLMVNDSSVEVAY